ncbi:MAG: DNA-3-methyladenine glycosylase 2 family protein [Austwickia sp.]|nr:DNA-3-methyladenine glycosylase 2 family protein [Austwickia sp.]MBK8435906.1 DNA-3-methyladenine glycosylase 2 family protein [Austwickia sp.]MBK9101592.1 DNA-3-methyladenine glycosylase 2 family protein [Austwickia sp.]
MVGAVERRIALRQPLDLYSTLSVVRRGAGDPTWLGAPSGRSSDGIVKGWNTPAGPVTAVLRPEPGTAALHATAWGPGADWLLERLARVVADEDDDAGFRIHHDVVRQLRRRFAHWRVPATGLVIESLVPSIIEQRVTGKEAFGSYRALVRAYGDPAPGPLAERGLMVAPTARRWASIPSWGWTTAGVDSGRAATVVQACARAGRLEEVADDPAAARRRLAALPGVGRWTVAEVAHTALGDPDAVSFGDYHVAKNIGWALTGRPVEDAQLAELLEPYTGHRYRVQRLIELGGLRRPRRGPRTSLPTHLPG